MTKEIKALIIDDEKSSHEVLTALLREIAPNIQIEGNAYGVQEGYQLVRRLRPDVVFLDVQMPDGTGFDLIEMMDDELFKVIFITAYDHFAIKALRLSAIDFLMKPIKLHELKNAVDRLKQIIPLSKKRKDQFIDNVGANLHNAKIAINSLQKIRYISVKDIIYCRANGPYTEIHIKEGTYLMASKTLSHFEEILLDYNFHRVHRSSLINMNEVLELHKMTDFILMSNGIKIKISHNAKDYFLKKMQGL